jgi:DnaJ domain
MAMNGKAEVNLSFILWCIVNALLYPYARFVYESCARFIIGANIIFLPLGMHLCVKIITMCMCWFGAVFIAPVGLLYLGVRFYRIERKPKPDLFADAIVFVKLLEQERVRRGYQPGWLYYKCVKNPLHLKAFEYLQASGEIRASYRRKKSNENKSSESKASFKPKEEAFDPYAVLGVSQGASQEDIRSQYKEQMKLYHPDKVAHLGAELQKLALEKSKEIQRAYSMLCV